MHPFRYGGKEQMNVLVEQQGKASICLLFWELGFTGSIGICVFDGAAPSLAVALAQAGEERYMWELAGT
jgi:hypothetical protein